jgi:hypothetical protein
LQTSNSFVKISAYRAAVLHLTFTMPSLIN